MMKIRVFNSEKEGKVNEINLTLATAIDSEYIVGRSPQSGLILDSSDVSRQHGKFFFQNEEYYYSDLGSANGSLINDKLAKKNRNYLLKSGDVIRIGEFVLIMEAITEETEALPATVLNSDWQSFAKFDAPEEVAAQIQEPVNEVPELATSEFEPSNLAPEELSQGSKVTSIHALEEAEAEVVAQTSDVVSKVYEPEKIHIEEMTYIQAPEEFEEVAVAEASTIQVPEELEELPHQEAESAQLTAEIALEVVTPGLEVAAVPEEVIQTPEEEEEEEFEEEVVVAEATTIQPPEEEEEVLKEEAESAQLTADTTPETVTPAPEAASVSEDVISTPEEEEEFEEEVVVAKATTIQVHKELEAVPEDVIPTPEEEEEEEFEEVVVVVAEATTIQPPEEEEEVLKEEAESAQLTAEIAPEVVTPGLEVPAVPEDVIPTPEEEEEEEFEEVVVVVAEATTIQPPEEEEEVPEEEAESAQLTAEIASETVTPAPEVASVSEDVIPTPKEAESEEMAQPPEIASKAFEIISKKYIALMAHDTKKPELVQFVNQHKAFLSKCLTIATPSISETLYQQTGLAISQKTPLVPAGGYQAIASLIGTGEILAVILLRDFMVTQSSQANEEALLRLCNINQVLVATNVSTAEAVMHYVKDMVTSL